MRKLLVWSMVLASTAFLFMVVNGIRANSLSALTDVSQAAPQPSATVQRPIEAEMAPTNPGDPMQVGHYVGITHAALPVTDGQGSPLLALNRACYAEFPG